MPPYRESSVVRGGLNPRKSLYGNYVNSTPIVDDYDYKTYSCIFYVEDVSVFSCVIYMNVERI